MTKLSALKIQHFSSFSAFEKSLSFYNRTKLDSHQKQVMGRIKNVEICSSSTFIFILFIGSCFSGLTSAGFQCPDLQLISPCDCYFDFLNTTWVSCKGPLVTQEVIDNLIPQLRAANNLNSEDVLEFDRLQVEKSSITHLNLTSFLSSPLKVDFFSFIQNSNLTSIVGPPLNSRSNSDSSSSAIFWTLIQARYLEFSESYLKDAGFGDTLKYFNSSALSLLFLQNNDLEGQPGPEFLPGLSSLTSLTNLNLNSNKLKEFSGGPFRKLSKLKTLSIMYNRRTEEDDEDEGTIKFGDDAFLFDEETSDGNQLVINSGFNRLKDEDFNNHRIGLFNSTRSFYLYLGMNLLTTLGQENFQPFLLARDYNKMEVAENDLICDERMSWLKNKTREYSDRVLRPFCINDPDHQIWDTDLIP